MAGGRSAVLGVPQSRVEAIGRIEQLGMGPSFDHGAFVQHEDLIGVDDGGQAVSDANRRAVASCRLQRLHYIPKKIN